MPSWGEMFASFKDAFDDQMAANPDVIVGPIIVFGACSLIYRFSGRKV